MVEKKSNRDKIGRLLNMLFFIALFVVGGSVMLSQFKLPNNFKLYTVLSGSMEPLIKTGSVVFVKPSKEYAVGDVITFSASEDTKIDITHRINAVFEEEGITKYETKGDVNDAPDMLLVPKVSVLGRVFLSIPLLGYVVNFAKTQLGFILMIVLPVTLIIYGEVLKIKTEILKKMENKKKKTELSDA